jgi:hypothetical protein
VLDVEIVATPFEYAALHEAIRKAYGDESVNFPTFSGPAFLEDPASAAILKRQKVEQPGPTVDDLPSDQVVLATLTYRSLLANEDAPREGQALPNPARTRMRLGSIEGGWRLEDGVARVFSSDPTPPSGPVVLTEYRFSEYRRLQAGAQVSEHEVRTRFDAALPLVVHPTEVQLTGVEADGTLRFHAYDRILRFAPGERGLIDVAYHFLSYGNRMRRTLEIDLHRIVCVPRDRLEMQLGSSDWKAAELARWFGLPETTAS